MADWYVALWVIWGMMFVVLETIGIRSDQDRLPPLTQVVHRWVPAIIVIPGLIWLVWHAFVTYGMN